MTPQDLQEQQFGTRRQKVEFGGQEMMRHFPCSGRKMLDNTNSSRVGYSTENPHIVNIINMIF